MGADGFGYLASGLLTLFAILLGLGSLISCLTLGLFPFGCFPAGLFLVLPSPSPSFSLFRFLGFLTTSLGFPFGFLGSNVFVLPSLASLCHNRFDPRAGQSIESG